MSAGGGRGSRLAPGDGCAGRGGGGGRGVGRGTLLGARHKLNLGARRDERALGLPAKDACMPAVCSWGGTGGNLAPARGKH